MLKYEACDDAEHERTAEAYNRWKKCEKK